MTNIKDTGVVNFVFHDKDIWLPPLSHKESTRYLGVWISLFDNTTFIKSQVSSEFKKVKHVLDKKRLTAKQIVAVFNSVIIPRIIYKTKLTFLPASFCNMMMASFRAFFKNKLRLTKSLPAPIIHSTFGYNLAHLYDRQILAKSSDLLKMINDIALLGNTARLRVMQLQLLEWLPLSPITNWPYNNPSKFKDWWSAFLSAAKLTGLTFGQCLDENFPLTQIMGGSIPISSILSQDSYRKSIKNMRILSIMFVDQLVSMDGHHLFTSFDIN